MKSLRWLAAPVAVVVLAVMAGAGFAAEGAADDPMTEGIDLLARFFVLSVVIEVAFSTLFNWKVFLVHLHDKGYKTPILVVSLFVFCWSTGLDIVGDLVKTLFPETDGLNTFIGMFLTALLLAGGSGAMNTLFDKLKIRDRRAVDERAQALRAAIDKA